MNRPLLHDADSVIEVLWDLALAVFVVRLAFVYVLTATTAFALFEWGGHYLGLPSLLRTASTGAGTTACTAFFTIFLIFLSTHAVVGYFQVPRLGLFRLAIGVTAVLYVGLGGLLVSLVHAVAPALVPAALVDLLPGNNNNSSGGHFILAIHCLALMPWLSMLLAKAAVAVAKKSGHGHCCHHHRQEKTQPTTVATSPTEKSDKTAAQQ